MKHVPTLVYGNKMDIPSSVKNVSTIARDLRLDRKSANFGQWYIQPSCAQTADGLYEGLEWMSDRLK